MKNLMRIATLSLSLAVVGVAHADVCGARFFHDGGEIEIGGSGVLTLNAKLAFSQVKKTTAEVCQAHVRGFAKYAMMGMLNGSNQLDHLMKVNTGMSSLTKPGSGKTGDAGQFDLRLFSLFGYGAPIQAAGQRFPAQSFKLVLGDPGQPTTPLTVRMSEKTVGSQESIQTALGKQSCWPVRYARNTDATVANVRGMVIPVPAIQSKVTDWFCPQARLVMKQEIDQSGQKAVIEVKSVK